MNTHNVKLTTAQLFWLELAIGSETMSILKRVGEAEAADDVERETQLLERLETAKDLAVIFHGAATRAVEAFENSMVAEFAKELDDL
jgi:hypothetical protein